LLGFRLDGTVASALNVPRAAVLHLFCRMTNYEQVQNPDEYYIYIYVLSKSRNRNSLCVTVTSLATASPIFVHIASGHFWGFPFDQFSFLFTAREHCKRCISYSSYVCLSVCPSVCPSHSGIVSKRRHVARCSLHRWIAKCV